MPSAIDPPSATSSPLVVIVMAARPSDRQSRFSRPLGCQAMPIPPVSRPDFRPHSRKPHRTLPPVCSQISGQCFNMRLTVATCQKLVARSRLRSRTCAASQGARISARSCWVAIPARLAPAPARPGQTQHVPFFPDLRCRNEAIDGLNPIRRGRPAQGRFAGGCPPCLQTIRACRVFNAVGDASWNDEPSAARSLTDWPGFMTLPCRILAARSLRSPAQTDKRLLCCQWPVAQNQMRT